MNYSHFRRRRPIHTRMRARYQCEKNIPLPVSTGLVYKGAVCSCVQVISSLSQSASRMCIYYYNDNNIITLFYDYVGASCCCIVSKLSACRVHNVCVVWVWVSEWVCVWNEVVTGAVEWLSRFELVGWVRYRFGGGLRGVREIISFFVTNFHMIIYNVIMYLHIIIIILLWRCCFLLPFDGFRLDMYFHARYYVPR